MIYLLNEEASHINSPDGTARSQAVKDARDPLESCLSQVSIGLGPDHPATEALRAAATSYTRADAALGELAYGPGIAYMPDAQIEIEQEVGEVEERIAVECEAFKSAHAAFIEQAHLAAGARLPTDTRG